MKKRILVLTFIIIVQTLTLNALQAKDDTGKASINAGKDNSNPAKAEPSKTTNFYTQAPDTITPNLLTNPSVLLGQNPSQSRSIGYGYLKIYNRYAAIPNSADTAVRYLYPLTQVRNESRRALNCNLGSNIDLSKITSFEERNGQMFSNDLLNNGFAELTQLQSVTGWSAYATCSVTPSQLEDIRVLSTYNEASHYCAETNCDFMITGVRASAPESDEIFNYSSSANTPSINYVGRYPRRVSPIINN